MKFETVMLHSLFAACLLICTLALGSMLKPHPISPAVAAGHVSATASAGEAG